jgi:hypothetical protein
MLRRTILATLFIGVLGGVRAGEFKTPLYICGDINGDSTLTAGDGFELLKWFGSEGFVSDPRAADINGDCAWTTGDGYQLLNYFGSLGEMDCDGCWPGCTNC